MSDLADLFPGFESHHIDTPAGKIFARTGGTGTPLLLLHGYPQTGVMWHKMAPELAKTHRLIIPDLPGYGWSAAPAPTDTHAPYSKRVMGEAMVRMMEHLGHAHFAVAAHDRGARVGYRIGLDHPGRLDKLAVFDILPSSTMWNHMDKARAMSAYHWMFLAQPYPFPETVIGKDPRYYFEWTLASWTAAKDLSAFDPRALAHYRASFEVPERIRAMCEDYRAGATIDLAHDEADLAAGRIIDCPVLAVWGTKWIPGRGANPLDAWRAFAPGVVGAPVDGGHFVCEEAPEEVLAALVPFLAQ